jgi:class 3 adenylate cyclase
MDCPSCGTPAQSGQRFCANCGTRLERTCEACGNGLPAEARFCPSCGTAVLVAGIAAAPAPPASASPAPQAERRLVSVLFCDLVGFTGASETRGAEATRELLTRYYDLCRERVERYGGTIEKFVGDAVMAVWGVPMAHEDDAERAVRAALELVATATAADGRADRAASRPASA